MRGHLCVAAILIAAGFSALSPARGCTSFAIHDSIKVAAKNYDWDLGVGLVMVNQRGVEKSFSLTPDSRAPTWVSRYGSVTFNQYGRDLPQGGMNEEGLVVEALWLEGTVYPPDDARVNTDCCQWIQHTLDTAASVEEAVAGLSRVQIVSTVPLHYFVADRHGDAAGVEFLAGYQVIHEGDDMPFLVLTNTPYDEAAAYVQGRREGAIAEDPRPNGSRNRFHRAATMLDGARSHSSDPVSLAFEILASVASPGYTQWSIVYDQTARVIHFHTREIPTRRTIRLDDVAFSCAVPAAIADIEAAPVDGAVSWKPYALDANLALIRRAYDGTSFLAGLPDSLRALVASYPDRSRCVREK